MSSSFGNGFDSGFNYVYVRLSLVGFFGFGWVSVFFVIFVRISESEFYRGYVSI